MPTTATNADLASMSAWDMADAFGCHYSGDCNAFEHGGFFYDARDWERYGYASCVEFWQDPESRDTVLIIQRGTINKPDDMSGAFRCCDVPEDERDNLHAQIEACRYYCGIEPDGACYPSLKTFKLDDWPHWRNIVKSVRPWLEALGE